MKFGHFDDAAKEYVITSPKTPLPWINYLGCEDFFSLVSNTCGGYSFYKDAKLLRLTRYRYNNIPYDSNGHYYYIKDGDTIWNPGWMPAKTELDSYQCRHGLGYSVFEGSKNQLSAELTMFVPMGNTCEINKLTLTNHGSEHKEISVFSYVEFCLWNAMDDMTNFQRNFSTGEVEIHGSALYHKTEYRERRNHYAVYAVNTQLAGFDTDRESFLGAYGENSAPEVVINGTSKNSVASGWSPIGSHHIKVSLAPGESKSFVFVLGYVENPVAEKWDGPAENGCINRKPAEELLKRFDTTEKADAALAELKEYWNNLLNHFTVSSSEEKLDRMVNIWHQYQCMVTFNMSRSASYFESGIGRGMGFRDSCQDLLGFVHLIPDRARQRILDIASTQFVDGSAYHQYQPLTKKGNADIGSGFNDDPLWLIAGTAAYIKETGDYSILDEITPYDNDESKSTDFMEHLRRSFNYTRTHLGPHGLPLIGRADWNDCLNLNCFSEEPGESFQTFGPSEGPNAESVFIAGMFVKYGKDYVEICKHKGLEEEAKEAEEAIFAAAEKLQNDWRTEYTGTDEGITVTVKKIGETTEKALEQVSQEKIIFFLVQVPYGIQKMSGSIEGLVETSINPGILMLNEEECKIVSSVRSSIDSAKDALTAKVCYLSEFLGGDCVTEGDYPAWEYRKESKLRDIMVDSYKELFGDGPEVKAIHAGLECGLFYEKIEGLDAVSFGPTMKDIHTTEEVLSISSTARMWDYLVKVLENIKA